MSEPVDTSAGSETKAPAHDGAAGAKPPTQDGASDENASTGAGESAPPSEHELGFELPPPYNPSKTRTTLVLTGVAAILAAGFLGGYLPKLRARSSLEKRSADVGPLNVEVVHPVLLPDAQTLSLPASVQPLSSTTVYPRASGYVHAYYKDLGDVVKAGDLLAVLDAPELDQQLLQARAQLEQVRAALGQAEAQRDLAHLTLERYRALAPRGVTSQQEVDQYAGQAQVDDANVRAAEASVHVQEAEVARLAQLKAFTRVTSPFAGTVISRTVDLGALLSAGNATPMFQIAASNIVRVFIDVPQGVAASVHVGADAEIKVREFPGRIFRGTVARAAGALDDTTRTMRTEVRAPNPDGALLAGMFADVALSLRLSHPVYEIPGSALVSNGAGVRVACVDGSGIVHMKPVSIERDTGATVQLSGGLNAQDRVVRLPGPTLRDGLHVQTIEHKE